MLVEKLEAGEKNDNNYYLTHPHLLYGLTSDDMQGYHKSICDTLFSKIITITINHNILGQFIYRMFCQTVSPVQVCTSISL